MDRQALINVLKNFLKDHGDDISDDLRKQIEDLINKLESGADETLAAEALAELLEKLGGKLPPIVSDFVAVYVKALGSGIAAAEWLQCKRYNALREPPNNMDDADAARTADLSPHDHAICRARWDIAHSQLPPPPAGPTPNPPVTAEGLANDFGHLPPGPDWAEEDNQCCSKAKDLKPTINIQHDPLEHDGTGTYFTGKIEIHHECGILFRAVTATIGAATIGDGQPEKFPHPAVDDEVTDQGQTITYTFHTFQVGAKNIVVPSIRINVTAISKCLGRRQESFDVK